MTLRVRLEEGHIFLGLGLPWPPDDRPLLEQPLEDGVFVLSQLHDGRLTAELFRAEPTGPVHADHAESCPIICQNDNHIVFYVHWKDSCITKIRVNGKDCYTLDATETIAPCIELWIGDTPTPNGDFSEASGKARQKRLSRLQNWPRDASRIEGGRSYAFDSLVGEALQLRELISNVEAGKSYHLPGMMARVRLLLIGKPLGLLQLCAAYLDAPLDVYTNSVAGDRLSIEADAALWFSVSADISERAHQTRIDLDAWLGLNALTLNGKDYDNLLVIREIGNTIASHRDLDIQQSVAFLMSGHHETVEHITRYSLMVAHVVLHLAERLIAEEGRSLP